MEIDDIIYSTSQFLNIVDLYTFQFLNKQIYNIIHNQITKLREK